ncbi:hypothetical protein L596_006222 [Steinernema carpocapsae]|uniref:RNA-directed DNA polymerase n=1 Tax=Steinernema carpocapsae TaxID=34508 RepID=A0A4U8V1I6_STECR|nr:hypothetical protein L596_006222 [Steinernema carpocapsae]
MRLKPSKCKFCQLEVRYLGVLVSGGQVRVDPASTAAVRNATQPKTITQLQSFLGLANYFRKFLRDYAQVTAPLYALTKGQRLGTWTSDHTKAFEAVKLR